MTDLAYINDADISKKIISELGCNNFNADLEKNKNSSPYTLPASKLLYNSLTQQDKDRLSEYLKLDYAIYNDDSLFWKP